MSRRGKTLAINWNPYELPLWWLIGAPIAVVVFGYVYAWLKQP